MDSDSNNKLPFELTPYVHRLLQDISDFYEEYYIEETGRPMILRTYKGDEKPTEKKENVVYDVIEYLASKGAVEDISDKMPSKIIPASESDTGKDFHYIESYTLKIHNIDPVRELLGIKVSSGAPAIMQTRLIFMGGDGDFYRGKQREVISFRNKEDGAYQIFVAIYKLTDGAGGRVAFSDISRFMKERFKKSVDKKTITNAIDNTINRKRLVPIVTPEGRKILERDGAGESIVFNNPQI